MERKRIGLLLVLIAPWLLAPSLGCGDVGSLIGAVGGLVDVAGALDVGNFNTGNTTGSTDDGDTGNTDGEDSDDSTGDSGDGENNTGNTSGGTADLTVVKTTAQVHSQAGLLAGDDVIYYGADSGPVSYLIPSKGQTTGTAIPGAEEDGLVVNSFAVAGRKAAFTSSSNFHVFIFDPDSPSATTEIAEEDVRLATIPVGFHDPGHVQGSGHYFAVRNDSSPYVRVIDVSGDTPEIIQFTVDPDYSPWHVTLDADAQQVLAVAGDVFYVYDLTNPTATPETYDASGEDGIDQSTTPAFDGGYVIYRDDAAYGNTQILDTNGGTFNKLSQNPSGGVNVAVNAGKFAYFVNRGDDVDFDEYSVVWRTATGQDAGPSASVGGQPGDVREYDYPWDDFASVASIMPSGKYVFISGWESINIMSEFLQVSTDGPQFTPFADGDGYLAASDVSASDNCVGFKIGENEDTYVGYIVLE